MGEIGAPVQGVAGQEGTCLSSAGQLLVPTEMPDPLLTSKVKPQDCHLQCRLGAQHQANHLSPEVYSQPLSKSKQDQHLVSGGISSYLVVPAGESVTR